MDGDPLTMSNTSESRRQLMILQRRQGFGVQADDTRGKICTTFATGVLVL